MKNSIYSGMLPENFRTYYDKFEKGNLSHFEKSEEKKILAELNNFLFKHQLYEYNFARKIEEFRQFLERDETDTKPPTVKFGLAVQRLQFIDPANGTFAAQCEASVGLSIEDAISYLKSVRKSITEDDIHSNIVLGGIIWFEEDDIKDRLEALLKIRAHSGEIESWNQYYRYGNLTKTIWLIQNFTVKIYHKANFRNLPFDSFNFFMDLSIGLGGDIKNVKVESDVWNNKPTTLFSPQFDSGEFEIKQESAALAPIGYLQDPSYYFANVMRLSFDLKRKGRGIILRIIVPIIFMALMILLGSAVINDKISLITGLIPAVFLSLVALQLTASQEIPRGAPFSKLDKLFVITYIFSIIIFLLVLITVNFTIPITILLLAFYFITFIFICRRKYKK